jgi:hypothetical protein
MQSGSHNGASLLIDDLRSIFGERLRAVVGYGAHLDGDASAPLTCLALVSSLSLSDLEACATRASRWARARIATPLILPEDEFRRSLDAFPLEYGEIIRAHADLYGDNPLANVAIAKEDLRRACETQVKSHLVHLREEFIESRGTPAAVGELVRAAAPAFAALLRNVARLSDVNLRDRHDATRQGARVAGIPDGVVTAVLALERPSGARTADSASFFPEYLAAVEQLARAIDTWRA